MTTYQLLCQLLAVLLLAVLRTNAWIAGMETLATCNTKKPWSEWSECSELCGVGGVRTRTKPKIKTKLLAPGTWQKFCGKKTQKESCNNRECFKFALKGRSGNEQVRITTGDNTQTVNLEDRWQTFETSDDEVLVEFTNEPTPDGPGYGWAPAPERDVYFAWKANHLTGSYAARGGTSFGDGPVFLDAVYDWKCGTEDENVNKCNEMRNGEFLKGGNYWFSFYTSSPTMAPSAEPIPAPAPAS